MQTSHNWRKLRKWAPACSLSLYSFLMNCDNWPWLCLVFFHLIAFNFDIGCWNVVPETSPTPDCHGRDNFFSPNNKQARSFSIAGIGNGSGPFDFMEHPHARRLNSDPMPSFLPSIWGNGGPVSCASPFQTSNDGPNYFGSGMGAGFGMFNKPSLNSTGKNRLFFNRFLTLNTWRKYRLLAFYCDDHHGIVWPCVNS